MTVCGEIYFFVYFNSVLKKAYVFIVKPFRLRKLLDLMGKVVSAVCVFVPVSMFADGYKVC